MHIHHQLLIYRASGYAPPLPPTPGFGYKLKPNPALCSAHKLEYGSIGPFTGRGFFEGVREHSSPLWGPKNRRQAYFRQFTVWVNIRNSLGGRKASKQRHYNCNKLYILHIVVKITEILSSQVDAIIFCLQTSLCVGKIYIIQCTNFKWLEMTF